MAEQSSALKLAIGLTGGQLKMLKDAYGTERAQEVARNMVYVAASFIQMEAGNEKAYVVVQATADHIINDNFVKGE